MAKGNSGERCRLMILATCFLLCPSLCRAGGRLEINRSGGAPLRDGDIVSMEKESGDEKHTEWRVAYISEGLRVKGLLYMPAAASGSKSAAVPGVVFNHGGVDGIPGPLKSRCRELARKGYVVFAPSYRGEDGSEGEIEVAAGEVADVLNAVKLLRNMPEVDGSRIGMIGASHGGIITLLAMQRDAGIRAAVCAYGVTNTFTWYKYLVENGFDVSDPLSRKVYGKGPEDKPEAFRKRAPALDAHLIGAPLLLLYGEKDGIVPPAQGAELEEALKKKNPGYVSGGKLTFRIIPDVGHGFLFFTDPARRSGVEIERSAEAWKTVLDFLGRELGGGGAKAGGRK